MRKLLLVLLLIIAFSGYGITTRLLPADSTLLIVDGGGVVFTDTLRLSNSVYSLGALVLYVDSVLVAVNAKIDVTFYPFLATTTEEISGVAATVVEHVVETKDIQIFSDTLPLIPEAQLWIVTIEDNTTTFGTNDSCYVDPYFMKIPR